MRIPLHFKLMGTYLLVVGLVFGPTVVYLRTTLERDQHARARAQLAGELTGIADRLGEAGPAELAPRVNLLLHALPTRLTVVDAAGNVLGDSFRPGAPLENHANRPEVRAALRDGEGSALRRSATTGQVMLYVARRFPAAGPVRGVARLARPESEINAATDQATDVVRNASAVGLSAAVLLSLVAALAASRPLRRIAAGARSFAAGDFGATIDVNSRDEIGEVADALEALASQLRARLLTAGVDRATLQALLDDLPVGVILYDADLHAVAINGAARVLCGLAPQAELERAAEIARLPGCAQAAARALRDGLTVEAPLALPWRPEAALRGRWVAVFAPDGRRLPALVAVDQAEARRADALQASVATLAAHVRALAPLADDAELAARAAGDALRAEDAVPPPPLAPEAVAPVEARALYDAAAGDVAAFADAAGVRLTFEAREGDGPAVDADGRARRALRAVLRWAIERAGREGRVAVAAAERERSIRFSVRAPRAAESAAPDVAWLVRPLGGDAGVEPAGDGVEAWVRVPRA
ncbi:MAG: HAMP domain-containing protein [Polyangiales bacterium]